MPRPIHFDITADDPHRAAAFYSSAFGWTFSAWEGSTEYWLVSTGDGPGIDGGLAPRQEGGQPIVNTIGVPSVDDYSTRVTEAGGTILQPKSPIPGVGWLAMFADTEGNVFGMMEADESAGAQ